MNVGQLRPFISFMIYFLVEHFDYHEHHTQYIQQTKIFTSRFGVGYSETLIEHRNPGAVEKQTSPPPDDISIQVLQSTQGK